MTANRKLIVPKPGIRVPDPERRDYLPPGGREIDLHGPYLQHWGRRIADGDVTVSDVQGESSGKKSSNPAAPSRQNQPAQQAQ